MTDASLSDGGGAPGSGFSCLTAAGARGWISGPHLGDGAPACECAGRVNSEVIEARLLYESASKPQEGRAEF